MPPSTLSVTARDLMRTRVITLKTNASIREAIETFEEYRISGAPVENEGGRLVGVLSAFDIAKSEHIADGGVRTSRGGYYFSNPLGEEFEEAGEDDTEFYGKDDYSDELLGNDTVGDWMTPDVISIGPDATLKDVCELMTAEGIHRVLVMEGDKLEGIISTFDVVKFLARNL